MYRIIGADGKEYGPITADQVRLWISEGRINATSKVRREEDAVWKTAGDFPEFAALLTTVPPAFPRPHPSPITYQGTAPKNNPLALWSMITGIASVICCCILAPVSIILGVIGLSQLKKDPTQQGQGFAITGIVLGILALILMIITAVITFSNPELMDQIKNALNQR